MPNCNTTQWFWVKFTLSTVSLIGLIPNLVSAQVIPDNSLGNEGSIVNPNVNVKGNLADLIEGGAIRDSNLFHSFEQFSVGDGGRVYFANPDGIANILTRVTGNNISEIFGTLGVDGAANLFLLNPNGIVFGENASLDVSGSFLATTADSYIFENGFAYSAVNPGTPPLLTINIPVGLQMGTNPGDITVQGAGHNLTLDPFTFSPITDGRPTGLEVKEGNTLALIGGEINLTGGNLTAPAGNIELGSVGQAGVINIIPTTEGFTLDYQQISDFNDINLSQATSLEASGNQSGNVQLQGKNITLEETSVIIANTLGSANGGEIQLSATDSVTIMGMDEVMFPSGIFHEVEATGTGNSDRLTIATEQLNMSNNALISNAVRGSGNGGNTKITAGSVKLTNGSIIGTRTAGEGYAGDINLTITDTLEIDGQGSFSASGVSSTVGGVAPNGNAISGQGNGGEIKITAGSVKLTNGGSISGSTAGEGDAGDINLTITDSLHLREGGTISSSSELGALGNGGNVQIQTNLIELNNGHIATTSQSDFAAGSIEINSNQLQVNNQGTISVSSFGNGNSGNLNIIATELNLDNSATIEAKVNAGNQGNINLTTDNIFLNNQSQITVEATGTATGGNITINNSNLILSQNDSDIRATAVFGSGGNININTELIFTDFTSDLDASSQFGIDGVVEIQSPESERELGESILPESIEDTTSLVTASCPTDNKNTFALTGNGGIVQSPYQDQSLITTWQDLRPINEAENQVVSLPSSITEAGRMVINAKGNIELVAINPLSPESWIKSSCPN